MPHLHQQTPNKKPREKDRSTSHLKQLQQWLDSFEAVSAAVEQHGELVQLLADNGGICKIDNFLPDFVAEGIHQTLEQFSEADWNVRCSVGVVAAAAAAAAEGRQHQLTCVSPLHCTGHSSRR